MAFDSITAVIDGITTIFNKYVPDATESQKAAFQFELTQMQAITDLAKGQLEINKVEAGNSNLFVSGWRPFIGWVCGSAFAYMLILQPFMVFALAACGHVLPPLPNIDSDLLGWALGGVLGLGGFRSLEKIKGVSK